MTYAILFLLGYGLSCFIYRTRPGQRIYRAMAPKVIVDRASWEVLCASAELGAKWGSMECGKWRPTDDVQRAIDNGRGAM